MPRVWTLVQGILAPLQFLVFLVSLVACAALPADRRRLRGRDGLDPDQDAFFLMTIMVTGAIWEKVVFGQYLFAPAFFWEDVFSFVVIALHTAYVWALLTGALAPDELMCARAGGLCRLRHQRRPVPAGSCAWRGLQAAPRRPRHDRASPPSPPPAAATRPSSRSAASARCSAA